MTREKKGIVCLALMLASVAPFAGCGAGGRAAGRVVSRRAARSAGRALPRVLSRDLKRDAATAARPLSRPRTFQRYVGGGKLRSELRRGIAPNHHLASARSGRPLTGLHAQRRYGLPVAPRYRETVRVPKGFPMKLNRALGGKPGFGEVVAPRRIPPDSIRKVVPLR